MNHLLTIALALSTPAHAGKLADGFRGIPYGPQSSPARIDGPCVADPEPGIIWGCRSTVGETPVFIAPAYEHGRLYGWMIVANGYTHCDTLMDTLLSAYGPGTFIEPDGRKPRTPPSKLDERAWLDEPIFAMWKYNPLSEECRMTTFHPDEHEIVKAAQAAHAAKGASDL